MEKSKYIGRNHIVDRYSDFVLLKYEYRGHTYEVYENRKSGNEPLSWQHSAARSRIDTLIDIEDRSRNSTFIAEPAEIGLNKFFEYCDSGEWKD